MLMNTIIITGLTITCVWLEVMVFFVQNELVKGCRLFLMYRDVISHKGQAALWIWFRVNVKLWQPHINEKHRRPSGETFTDHRGPLQPWSLWTYSTACRNRPAENTSTSRDSDECTANREHPQNVLAMLFQHVFLIEHSFKVI